jgi:hypothetical protein
MQILWVLLRSSTLRRSYCGRKIILFKRLMYYMLVKFSGCKYAGGHSRRQEALFNSIQAPGFLQLILSQIKAVAMKIMLHPRPPQDRNQSRKCCVPSSGTRGIIYFAILSVRSWPPPSLTGPSTRGRDSGKAAEATSAPYQEISKGYSTNPKNKKKVRQEMNKTDFKNPKRRWRPSVR